MSKKLIMAGLCIAVAAACAVVLSGTAKSKHGNQIQQVQEQANPVPDYVVYRMLLHHVYLFNEKAEKAERDGKKESAHAYRSAFKNHVQINDAQIGVLNEIAAECEWAVKDIDARAKIIIDARREHYKRTGDVLPPSEELQALQTERNATILRYRDRLHEALGEQEWTRFQEFVRQRVVPNINTTLSGSTQSFQR